MPWLQNLAVITIFFLFARMFIHRGFHLHLVAMARKRKDIGSAGLANWIMTAAYVMSLFFPNTIVVLACLPVIRDLSDSREKAATTRLALALLYGANIGGMGSITGSPLNLVFFGFLQFHRVPGYTEVTFFSWLVVGIPVSLVLLAVGWLVLRMLPAGKSAGLFTPDFRKLPGNAPWRRFALTAAMTAVALTALSAIQFALKPRPIAWGMNVADLIFLILVLFTLGYAFILPHRSLRWSRVWRNAAYLFLNLLLFPLIYLVETWREIRLRCCRSGGSERSRWEHIPDRMAMAAWRLLFKRPLNGGIRAPYRGARVGINGMIYDLPFFGLFFMGLVMLFVLLLVSIGDNPATPHLDGIAVHAMEWLTGQLMPVGGGKWLVMIVLVGLSIFLTELVNNAVVVLLMLQLILTSYAGGDTQPLWAMAAVTFASSAAFMTPVATSVNAVVFVGLRGVSLKRMVLCGLLMNVVSAGWLILAFYFLSALPIS